MEPPPPAPLPSILPLPFPVTHSCNFWTFSTLAERWYGLEDGQGDVLLPGAVLAHADPKAGAEEKLPRGHQVTLLRGFKLQHGRVPDERVELAVGEKGEREAPGSRPDPNKPHCSRAPRNGRYLILPPCGNRGMLEQVSWPRGSLLASDVTVGHCRNVGSFLPSSELPGPVPLWGLDHMCSRFRNALPACPPAQAPSLTCPGLPVLLQQRSRNCVSPCADTWCSAPPAAGNRCPQSSASPSHR